MSLINDALKNAQRGTHGNAAPAVRETHISDGKSVSGDSKAGLMVALLVVIGGGVGAYLYFGAEPAKEPVIVPAAAPEKPAEVKAAEPVVVAVVKPAVVVAVLPAVPAEVVAPVVVAPVQNPEILGMIAQMKVGLARKATGLAQIDGQMVKVGTRLCEAPAFTFTAITATSVVFTDAAGVTYEARHK